MNIRIATRILTATLLCTVGCSTRTRLGALIPAHHGSNKRDGEQVWLHVAPGEVSTEMSGQSGPELAPSLVPVAAAGVGLAVDFVKNQLQQESQLYDAQFGQKVWLTTDELTNGKTANVLLTRWVTGPHPRTPEYTNTIEKIRNIVNSSVAGSVKVKACDFEAMNKSNTLAFAYCLEMDRARGGNANSEPAPFLVRPQWKWQLFSKAKVVSFHSYQPWSWLGAVLLKTGNEVEYDVYLTVDSLLRPGGGVPRMTTVGIGDPIQGPERFDLSGAEHFRPYEFGSSTFGWIAIPGYPKGYGRGYLSLQVTVNESDPSNVKKTLLKGAEYLDKNKQGIAGQVMGRSD